MLATEYRVQATHRQCQTVTDQSLFLVSFHTNFWGNCPVLLSELVKCDLFPHKIVPALLAQGQGIYFF